MAHQFNRFSQKYEKNDFEIFLTPAHDYDDVIKGKMVFLIIYV